MRVLSNSSRHQATSPQRGENGRDQILSLPDEELSRRLYIFGMHEKFERMGLTGFELAVIEAKLFMAPDPRLVDVVVCTRGCLQSKLRLTRNMSAGS